MKRKSFLVATLAVITSMILPTTAFASDAEEAGSQTAEVVANLESHFEYSVNVVEDVIELSEDATVKLVTDDLTSIKTIEWVILKDGVEVANAITDPLSTVDPFGGKTKFADIGDYTVIARITDKFGVEHEPQDVIKVTEDVYYRIDGPTETKVGDITPERVATNNPKDTTNAVWTLEKDGKPVNINDYITGPLDVDGGSIKFKEPGEYDLIGTFTDADGDVRTATKHITVVPAEDIKYEIDAPKDVKPNEDVPTKVVTNNPKGTASIVWRLEKDGQPVNMSDYIEGDLDVNGGTIKFKEPGEYDLIGDVTDVDGDKWEIRHHFSVKAPEDVFYRIDGKGNGEVGENLPQKITTNNPKGVASYVWTLEKDGKPVSLGDYITGTLDANGGTISFKEPGEYDLTGTFTDEDGNVWTVTKHFSIKAKPSANEPLTFESKVPRYARTNDDVDLSIWANQPEKLASAELKILDASGLNELNLADIIDGSITKSGGTVRFKKAGDYTVRFVLTDTDGQQYILDNPITVTDATPTQPATSTTTTATNTGSESGSGSGNSQPTGNGNSNNGTPSNGTPSNVTYQNTVNTPEPGVLGVIRQLASNAGDGIADFLEDNMPAVLGESRSLTEDGKVVETRDASMLMLALVGMAAALVGLGVYSKKRS